MRFLTAEKVFDGMRFLAPGSVLVLNNQNLLSDVLPPDQIEENRILRLEGLLCPGFVNAHCHLELSHLRGRITAGRGFAAFAMELMPMRGRFEPGFVEECMQAADAEMKGNGIVAVGDICNGQESLKTKTRSSLYYHSYVELIGLNPESASQVFSRGKQLLATYSDEGLSASLAAHAPYSVSLELLGLISEFDRQHLWPFSIHNQESQGEEDFLMAGKSSINALYEFLQLDISYFKAPGKNSLMHLGDKIQARPRTFVHNTFSSINDIRDHSDAGTYWCFCPGANLYIEERLPDFENFYDQKFCFGTDSLASNSKLDLISEANLLLSHSRRFTVEQVLQGLTSTGAAALGLQDRFGMLQAGKNAGLNQVNIKDKSIRFIQKIC